MKLNSFFGGCLIATAIVSGAFLLCCDCNKAPVCNTTETNMEVTYDTIPVFVNAPVPKDSTVITYVTIPVPVSDTTTVDTLQATIPITQKMYRDSTYQAWVSGYMPALDSICVFQHTKTITKTITNTQVIHKAKRWGLGVQIGFGVTPNKFEPYVGIGVSYNIFSW